MEPMSCLCLYPRLPGLRVGAGGHGLPEEASLPPANAQRLLPWLLLVNGLFLSLMVSGSKGNLEHFPRAGASMTHPEVALAGRGLCRASGVKTTDQALSPVPRRHACICLSGHDSARSPVCGVLAQRCLRYMPAHAGSQEVLLLV